MGNLREGNKKPFKSKGGIYIAEALDDCMEVITICPSIGLQSLNLIMSIYLCIYTVKIILLGVVSLLFVDCTSARM